MPLPSGSPPRFLTSQTRSLSANAASVELLFHAGPTDGHAGPTDGRPAGSLGTPMQMCANMH
eukprot:3281524-Alexandrium_andersonii.AAC.1